MKSIYRSLVCVALLLSPLIAGNSESLVNSPEPAESGTLAMIARTRDSVILSVDSRILFHNGKPPGVEGRRKLVKIGDRSACVVVGFLGTDTPILDVSSALRAWSSKHPTANIDINLSAMLAIVADVWNRHHYSIDQLPGARKIGSDITSLTCGQIINGTPTLVQGRTIVDKSGTAIVQRLHLKQMEQLLVVDGLFETPLFTHIVADPNLSYSQYSQEDAQLFRAIRSAMRFSDEASSAYNAWRQAEAEFSGYPVTSSIAPQKWNPASVKILFHTVFNAAETHSNEVGPPNNAIVIRMCGMLETTLDSSSWSKCQ